VPLDFTKAPYIALWTNVSFSLSVPRDGFVRIIAQGTESSGEWPILKVKNGTSEEQISINSVEYSSYDVPVRAGKVELTYSNDIIRTDANDRNIFIQNLYFSDALVIKPASALSFYTSDDFFCLYNKIKGTTEMLFTVVSKNELKQLDGVSNEALQLLEETGDIK
jgi:hypothetical protein